jgi:hypothetical protein
MMSYESPYRRPHRCPTCGGATWHHDGREECLFDGRHHLIQGGQGRSAQELRDTAAWTAWIILALITMFFIGMWALAQ